MHTKRSNKAVGQFFNIRVLRQCNIKLFLNDTDKLGGILIYPKLYTFYAKGVFTSSNFNSKQISTLA